jgi:opacity protein-like surface antigen
MMKNLLLTAVAALLLATEAAHADLYIPPQYRGIWCSVSNGHDIFRRCREPDSEVYIEIRADRISVGFEGDLELCGIGIGWPTENGHAFTVGCPKHEFSLQMELQLDTRGLLHVKEADRQEFGPPPPGALPR